MDSSSLPAMTPQQRRFTTSGSLLAAYKELSVGSDCSWSHLLWYEAITSMGAIPGALGMALRMALYPLLLGTSSGRPAIGRGVVIRHPRKLHFGRRVILDDYTCVEARGGDAQVVLGDHVVVGRFSTVAAKGGRISLDSGVNVGSYCRIATQSEISIGESTLIAAFCYLGPGNHQRGDSNTPLIAQEMDIRGGVSIGRHVWIGAHTTIVDGVTVGDGAIVGAHSFVRDDVPPGCVVAGVPARVIREG